MNLTIWSISKMVIINRSDLFFSDISLFCILAQSSKKINSPAKMKKLIMFLLMVPLLLSCSEKRRGKPGPHDLYFTSLATVWDEAIPIGNGITGALVWQKDGRLRISLDRADLWDLRPMENIGIPEWKFKWVYEQWKNKNYSEVQEKFDAPYDRLAGPTKIPGASIEFEISDLGEIC